MKVEIEAIDEVFNLRIEDYEPILVPTLGRACEIIQERFAGVHSDLTLIRVAKAQNNIISAIKEVRSMTGWGLKEAKDFVEDRVGRNFYAKTYYNS